jgi:plastocyanin
MPAPPPDSSYNPYPSYGYSISRMLSNRVRPTDDPSAPCQTNLWTVGVVASFGSQAFNPNPTMAVMGDALQWTNNDVTMHRLVLDDGTPTGQLIGIINPGDTTQPITLNVASATYHCTIHPSMVGYLGNAQPVTAAPSPTPSPDPGSGYQPPPDYNYGYRVRGR